MKSEIISTILLYFIYFSACAEPPLAKSRSRRIIGGNIARDNQRSYTVSLQVNNSHICTGEIIGTEHILTAAHCVMDLDDYSFTKQPLTAIIGTVDFKDENAPMIKIDVETLYVPKTFQVIRNVGVHHSDRSIDDIAILKLRKSIKLKRNRNLKKLELPKEPYPNYAGIRATVSGFGYYWVRKMINPTDGKQIEVGGVDGKMRYASTSVVTNEECKRKQSIPILDSDICAGMMQRNVFSPEGTCFGDSGGPLVYGDGNTNFLIGVLSSSPNLCNEKASPAVYARVTSYIQFIKDALKNKHTKDMRVAKWIVGQCQSTNSIPPILRELEYCDGSNESVISSCVHL